MPPKNDFSKQQAEFTKNLGVLNKALVDTNSKLKGNISEQTKLIKKNGAINVKAMQEHAKEVHIASRKIKSGVIQKEIELKSDKLEKTINGLSDATYKLDNSSEKFTVSAKDLSASNKELSSSMGDVVDITNKNMESLKYVGDHMKKFAKWAAIGGLAGAGYMGYKTLRGAGRLGTRAATAPVRAGVGAIKAYGDIQEGAATDVLGNVRTDLWGGYKKALGTGLALAGGGLGPGMFFESATANMFGGEGGGAGGPGIGSRMASGVGGAARRGMGGVQFGVGKLAEFVAGFPRETREKGIFKMMPAEGDNFEVAPSEEFSSELGTVSNKIEETNNLISEPDEKVQTKIMTKSFASALEESGRSGLFKRMFTGVFKLGSTIAYALPIFGAGYRAELPEVRRYGMFGAMLQTLGMIYVHTRFASEESNKLALQQARLLQIGFEIPGSLWRPGPRSLSEWIGKSIGDTLSGEAGPLTFMKDVITGKAKGLLGNILGLGKEKGAGLMGMIPGYNDWLKTKGVKKESEELRASPSLARKILLFTDIKEILSEMRDMMKEKGGSAMAKPISLAKAANQPHVVTKTGAAELHAGETVGGSGGLFSRMFGGIAGLFSGGIFKKIKAWVASIFAPLTSKIDQMLNWFKATFSFLEPAVQAMHEIETAFGVGKGSKITELAGGGGVLVQKRGKETIFGGIFNAIRELPIIVEKTLSTIGKNIKEIFSQEFDRKTGIGSIIIKAYQTLIPDIFKESGGKIFKSVKTVIIAALQSTSDLTRETSKFLEVLYNYGSKVVKPFQDAWEKGGSPFTKVLRVIGSIPKSTWEAIKGLIPLGKDLFKSIGNILNATSIIEKFSVSVQQASVIDIPNIISDVRRNLVEKILPDTWAKLFNTISDRFLEWSQVSFKSFYDAFEAMDEAATTYTESRIKRPGIAGVVTGIFQYLFKIVKAAFTPLGEAIVNTWNDIVWAGKGTKGYSLSRIIEDFGTLWTKMKIISSQIGESVSGFSSFIKAPAMAKGGLLYAAKGVVVGEAGAEAVIPLDDPRATAKISGMFSEALGNMGLGDMIINRLDVIIGILGGVPGHETKKAKIVKGTMSIFGRLLSGITDIGITLAKLPFQIGSDIAQGVAKGLSKGIEMLTDVGHTILTAMRTGFTAMRHTINAGVTTIKMAVKTAWATITAPFKAIGRFIMRPFEAIKDKYLKFKEKAKEKIKGVIQWIKPRGKKAPIAIDPEGKYVYAKWPALLVKYTKGIYDILLKEFGFGLPGFGGMKDKMAMVKNLIPTIMPVILTAIGVAGIAMAAFDAFRATKKAKKWHGVKEGEEASTSQKVTAGIGGFLGGTVKNLAARTAIGAAKGAAIGAGAAAIPTAGFGAPIGAAVGALAGGILGAIGGKNIAVALQAIWKPVKKIAVAIYDFVIWPFKIIGKLMRKFKNWLKGKIPWLGGGDKAVESMPTGSLFGRGSDWLSEKFGATGFAEGGIVTRPTMGLIGERGPEAVIPLNKFAQMMNGSTLTNPRAIAKHEAILEAAKQKVGADRLLEGNKRLQEAMASNSANNIVTSQVNNSNSLVNNAVSSNGSRQSFDEDIEKILSGRLN